MREANKQKCKYVYIIGTDEIKSGKGLLKNMNDSTQQEIPFKELLSNLSNKI